MNDDIAPLIEKIAAQLSSSAKPVRPLPSNAALWSMSLGIFLLLSFGLATVVRFKAIDVLSAGQMVAYYGVLLLFAALFSRAVIERMIPGSKRMVPSTLLSSGALVVIGMLVTLLFADRSTQNFVSSGVPCLRLGAISALIGGILGWRLLQRGYLVSPRSTITLYGLFAGLAGVSVLALHCPILNSLHVLVWHLGAMVLAGSAGFLVGSYAD